MLQRTRNGGRHSRTATARPAVLETPPGVESLRTRKKRATMHHIQQTAMDLFDEHGFDAITIEQVAAAADVSPSTIYRYFRTKEGLVLRDEYDEQVIATVLARLDTDDLATAARHAIEVVADPHFIADFDLSLRRTKLWLETPAIRTAGYALIAEYVDLLAQAFAEIRRGRVPLEDARVLMSALIWGMMAAIENWWLADGREPLDEHMRRAVAVLTEPEAMHR